MAAALPGPAEPALGAEAAALQALLGGLAIAVAREPQRMSAQRARAVVDAHLARLGLHPA